VGCPLEEHVPVLRAEVGSEHRDRGEVEAAVRQHGQDDRVLPGSARSRDAQVGLGPREVETLRAVLEHGGRGLANVEPADVDLANVGDELGLGVPRVVEERGEPAEELVVGNYLEKLHALHGDRIKPVWDSRGPFVQAWALDSSREGWSIVSLLKRVGL
jgi:hypothetical protein